MTCDLCEDTGWVGVGEDHCDLPLKGDTDWADACDRSAAPCPACNSGEAPRPPRGMRVAINIRDPRH